MDGRRDGKGRITLTGRPGLLGGRGGGGLGEKFKKRERNRVETDRERNRSEFHLCSVPLCEGSFAVVIPADVLHPVRRLQLSAAGNKPHIPPAPLSDTITRYLLNFYRSRELNERPWSSSNATREKNSTGLFPNKFVFLPSTDLWRLWEDGSDDSCAEETQT